jgi:hypothetical protein
VCVRERERACPPVRGGALMLKLCTSCHATSLLPCHIALAMPRILTMLPSLPRSLCLPLPLCVSLSRARARSLHSPDPLPSLGQQIAVPAVPAGGCGSGWREERRGKRGESELGGVTVVTTGPARARKRQRQRQGGLLSWNLFALSPLTRHLCSLPQHLLLDFCRTFPLATTASSSSSSSSSSRHQFPTRPARRLHRGARGEGEEGEEGPGTAGQVRLRALLPHKRAVK